MLCRYLEVAVVCFEAFAVLLLVLLFQKIYCSPLNLAAALAYAFSALLLFLDRPLLDAFLPAMALYASVGRGEEAANGVSCWLLLSLLCLRDVK